MHKLWQARFMGFHCEGDQHWFIGEVAEGETCECGQVCIGSDGGVFPISRIVGPEAGRCAKCNKFLDDHELIGSQVCR